MTTEEMYDVLVEYNIATEEFVKGAICMGGYNEETMERVLFYHTGWRTFEGFFDELNEEAED